jgi:hypothetical protein
MKLGHTESSIFTMPKSRHPTFTFIASTDIISIIEK